MDYGQIAVKIMDENILNDPFSYLLTRAFLVLSIASEIQERLL